MPAKNTTGNSSPLAECIVMSVTLSSSISALSISETKDTVLKKFSKVGSSFVFSKSFATLNNSLIFSKRVWFSTVFSFSNSAIYPDLCITCSIKSWTDNTTELFNISKINSAKLAKDCFAFGVIGAVSGADIASNKVILYISANSANLFIVTAPNERLGTLIIRIKLIVSSGL